MKEQERRYTITVSTADAEAWQTGANTSQGWEGDGGAVTLAEAEALFSEWGAAVEWLRPLQGVAVFPSEEGPERTYVTLTEVKA